jgi:hypothetical protein
MLYVLIRRSPSVSPHQSSSTQQISTTPPTGSLWVFGSTLDKIAAPVRDVSLAREIFAGRSSSDICVNRLNRLPVYVQAGIYDKLVAKLVENAKACAIGKVSRGVLD